MLKTVIDNVISKLEQAGVENVYSAFDAYAVEKKGSLFTIVGVGAFETSAPVYSLNCAYLPFKSEVEVNVTAVKTMPMTDLFDYYAANIEPVLMGMTDLECSLKKIAIKFDSNIQRLVLTVKMGVCGITRIERSSP